MHLNTDCLLCTSLQLTETVLLLSTCTAVAVCKMLHIGMRKHLVTLHTTQYKHI